MTYEKLPPIEGSVACLTCGCGAHDSLNMQKLIAVGFGCAVVTKDGETVYSEPQGDDETFWTAQDAENAAMSNPDHDWRIHFHAPLYDAVYQRHSDGHWPLIEKGMGFA